MLPEEKSAFFEDTVWHHSQEWLFVPDGPALLGHCPHPYARFLPYNKKSA